MKAFVCVKRVPNTSGKIAVNKDGTIDRDSMHSITNPNDLNAMEAALQLKDEIGCKVVVISMGPPPAETMLREMLAMGADEAVLISSVEFGGSDTFATSQIIASAITEYGFTNDDIVFCGNSALDGDTAQVGPQIAEKLGIPQVCCVTEYKKDGKTLTVKRMLEDGYMVIKVQTPCLITCIKEINTPRYATISGILEAYTKPYTVYDFNRLKDNQQLDGSIIGLKNSPTRILASFSPSLKGKGKVMVYTDKSTCAALVSELAKEHII